MPSELAKRSHSTVAAPTAGPILPAVIADAGEKAGKRFVEFLTATIRNANTRQAYARGREKGTSLISTVRRGGSLRNMHVNA